MLTAPGKTVRRARALRREMSLPEILLWRELRQRPGGFKFRKQHPAGHFVLDFFGAGAKLAIEIDGDAHSRSDQPAFDESRDARLALHGIQTLRISANDVLGNLDGVVRTSSTQPACGCPSTICRKRQMVPLPVPGRK